MNAAALWAILAPQLRPQLAQLLALPESQQLDASESLASYVEQLATDPMMRLDLADLVEHLAIHIRARARAQIRGTEIREGRK